MRTVLGIDPGARATGLCVLSGDQIVAHRTITSEGEIFPAERRYVLAVLEAGATLRQIHDVDLVAVETITRPSWHMKGRAAVDPTALLATAEVLGAVLGVTGPSTSPKSDPTKKTGHNHSAPTPANSSHPQNDAKLDGKTESEAANSDTHGPPTTSHDSQPNSPAEPHLHRRTHEHH